MIMVPSGLESLTRDYDIVKISPKLKYRGHMSTPIVRCNHGNMLLWKRSKIR